ncbi:MAG TPA: hypothetical protein VG714_07900 [Acidobacteriaceae bacterium]|nr:hypothetical protein [Acidobacteriaceae bacterium]
MNPLTKIAQRQSEFDGYTITGYMFQFLNEPSRRGWYVTMYSPTGGVKHYWVESDQFHSVVNYISTSPGIPAYLDIGDLAEVLEAEKVAVSRAVDMWTREHDEKADVEA